MNNIMDDVNNWMAQARAANEARYGTIIGGYDQQLQGYVTGGGNTIAGYNNVRKNMEHVGESQRLDLQDQYTRNLGQGRAALYSRGLGNSTIMSSADRGASRDYQRGQIQLMDALSRERAQVDMARLGYQADYQRGLANLQAGKLGFMERRTDAYPDLGMYANLARMQGMGAAGGPGMGGPTVGGFGAGSRGGGGISTTTSLPGQLMQGPYGTGTREVGGGSQTIVAPFNNGQGDEARAWAEMLGGMGGMGWGGGGGGLGGGGQMPFAQDWQAEGQPGWEFGGGGGGFDENPWGAGSNTSSVWGALGSIPVLQGGGMTYAPQYNPGFYNYSGGGGGGYGWGGGIPSFGGFGGGGGGGGYD